MSVLLYYGFYCVITIIILCVLIESYKNDSDDPIFIVVIYGIICFTNVICIVIVTLGLLGEGIKYLFNYKKDRKEKKELRLESINSYIKQCRGKK